MDRKKIPVVVVLVVAVACVSYWVYRNYYTRDESLIQATGTVEATTVELIAKLPGTIKMMKINAGDEVTGGQLVAELSRNDLLAQRERDALGVVKAESQLEDIASGARQQEKDEAAAGVDIARTNYQKARDDFDRAEALFNEEAIPLAEYDNARTKLDLAQNQLSVAESQQSLVNSGSRPQQVATARAAVEQSKAVLKTTETMLADLKIYSPIEGTVVTKNYEEGEYVQAGASLATVANLKDLWIKVYIPTDDLPLIKLGQMVKFTVSGITTEYNGVIDEIASKGEFTPKTILTKKERTNVVYGVKIKINNSDGTLKPGMPADVTFISGGTAGD
ncbi:HlyD family secretion protein [Desulfotomaculum arcticum]|uniref:HlyD family secretion protein n=1 Tax=Desulfotruncus arcticus DSM 17038 TaxID=1121424 RepID=A0A1I2U238_9FIRM|nr:efflux RND transporter periplasmic adaptor subunit [Desulfotruncus arcticus]SFG71188.1 HlyD family secretion protein [Desulfotomaculum arcticum] [Desulfotruncus arcticus DSM 17038]